MRNVSTCYHSLLCFSLSGLLAFLRYDVEVDWLLSVRLCDIHFRSLQVVLHSPELASKRM